jgi:hypothetical protein
MSEIWLGARSILPNSGHTDRQIQQEERSHQSDRREARVEGDVGSEGQTVPAERGHEADIRRRRRRARGRHPGIARILERSGS